MPSRSLDDCNPDLANAWRGISSKYEAAHPGRTLILTATYRSPEEQAELYAQGRTEPGEIVTNCDGQRVKSRHNSRPAEALDFCVLVQGKVSWQPADYAPVGALARQYGLQWGGDWTSIKDYPHVEMIA